MLESWVFWTVLAYLCGSISFALLLGRLKGVGLRQVGSGNPGATNLGRAVGRAWGVLCFVLDVLKGLVPVLVAGLVMGHAGRAELAAIEAWQWLAVAAGTICGHLFPVYHGFRGGKGVATGLGALLGFYPLLTVPALVAGGVWLVLLATLRYVSVASMAAAAAMPLLVLAYGWLLEATLQRQVPLLTVTALLAVLVVLRHLGNIQRLLAGTEPKVGRRAAERAARQV